MIESQHSISYLVVIATNVAWPGWSNNITHQIKIHLKTIKKGC